MCWCPQFEADGEDNDEDFAPKRSKKAGQASAAAARKPASKSKAKAASASPGSVASSVRRPAAKSKSKASASTAVAAAGPASIAASAAAAGKGSIKEKDAPRVVLEYMNVQNRPYSLINVFDNLHGAVKKASLSRVLEALAAEGKLRSKTYGKATIFWPDQAQYGEISDEMVAEQRAKVAALMLEQTAAGNERRAAEGLVARLKSLPSTEELREKAAEAEARVQKLRERLAACEEAAAEREAEEESGAAPSSSKAAAKSKRPPLVRGKGKKELDALLKKYVKVWKDRRRMVMDVVGQIEEGSGMKLKAVLDKAGIETDEDAGAVDPRTLC